MKILLLILILPLFAFTAENQFAQKRKITRKPAQAQNTQLFIGHNLTPSTDVLPSGKYTVGNYAAGFGITENLLVATSPWIWSTYNTMNLHLKYSQVLNPKSTVGVMASYFDSFGSSDDLVDNGYLSMPSNTPMSMSLPTGAQVAVGTNRYQWTSYNVNGLYSYRYDNGNTQYLNLKYSYFINDDRPYSLRMDPGDDGIRDQIDISTLVKFPIDNGASLAVEGGLLGLNYVKPFAHMGASVAFQKQSWLVQLGASYTVPLEQLGTTGGMNIGQMDERVHYSEIAKKYYTERYLQIAVHPEIQVQYNF
jgi:hypothetical protein